MRFWSIEHVLIKEWCFCQEASRYVFLLFEFTVRAFACLKWGTRVLTCIFSLFWLFIFCFDRAGSKAKVPERTNFWIVNETCFQWSYLCNDTLINYYRAFSLREPKNVWFWLKRKTDSKEISFWWIFLLNPGWTWQILLITCPWFHSFGTARGLYFTDRLYLGTSMVRTLSHEILQNATKRPPALWSKCGNPCGDGDSSARVPEWRQSRDPPTPTPAPMAATPGSQRTCNVSEINLGCLSHRDLERLGSP